MSWLPIIIALLFMVLILAMVIFVFWFDTKYRRPRPYTIPSMILYTFAGEFALYELLAAYAFQWFNATGSNIYPTALTEPGWAVWLTWPFLIPAWITWGLNAIGFAGIPLGFLLDMRLARQRHQQRPGRRRSDGSQ